METSRDKIEGKKMIAFIPVGKVSNDASYSGGFGLICSNQMTCKGPKCLGFDAAKR